MGCVDVVAGGGGLEAGEAGGAGLRHLGIIIRDE